MSSAQFVFMGVITGLGILAVLALLFTGLYNRLPTDPYKRRGE